MSLLLAALALLATGSSRSKIEFTKDTLKAVEKNVAEKKAVLVDVRSMEEWEKGHVEGALFVPITSLRKHSLDEAKLAKILPKKKDKVILYTYCVVGMRAKQAGQILRKQGYTVRVLKPGYEELVKAGFKSEKGKPKDEGARQRNAQ